jgi:(2Fe-2S) ferredoxin
MAIKDLTKIRKHLFLCSGGSCKLLGAEESTVAVRQAISERGLSDEIHTTKTLCNGRCKDGPIIISQPDGIWFKRMVKEKADAFVGEFLVRDLIPLENVLYEYGQEVINAED